MADLERQISALLPQGIVLASADLTRAQPPLWPKEVIAPAVSSRISEFAAGRAAARAALRALGRPEQAIPVGPDCAPIWPKGITGSISHCAGACMAMLADRRTFAAVGLDLEPLLPIQPDLWPSILRAPELARLDALPPDHRGLQALRMFVAKEATFKAQFMVTRAMIGFDVIEITCAGDMFFARFAQAAASFRANDVISGRFVNNASHLAALVWLPA